jgi:hypothetical protein
MRALHRLDVAGSAWRCFGATRGIGALRPEFPTKGKPVTITGITVDRFEDGKIVEGWTNWHTLGMMQRLGVVPEPAQV